MKKETISIKHLSTGYAHKGNRRVVTHDVCASLWSGELTCLLGANGAGKSTLLRTLSAFQPPLEGDVRVLGRSLSDYTPGELSTRIGVVLTEKPSLRNMSVEEMVGMGRSPYTGFLGRLRAADRRIVSESIRQVGIEHLCGRMMHNLSDGERQKVMIAKALAQQTPIIFLDEPTAYLDFPSKVEMMQLLHKLAHETHKTIFLSTHDVELALQLSDRLWLMHEQELHIGIPEDLALDGILQKVFCGKDIVFDTEEGVFRVHHPHHSSLCVVGRGVQYTLLCKALLRNGFLVTNNENATSKIEVQGNSEHGFEVWKDDVCTATFSRIEDVIQVVANDMQLK